MSTPGKLGLAPSPPSTTAKPPRCKACTDLGTVLLDEATRRPRTLPEMLHTEAPCVCEAGDLWRKLFDDFARPLPAEKGLR